MTIAKYINDLLYRYDCVIVPNFGGFITNRIGAKVNPFTNNFYPPTKQISFNAHLKQNDGLLLNYIASVENISFEKAIIKINETISSWEEILKHKQVVFDNIGNISLNENSQLIFEPKKNHNFLTNSFGLSVVSSPKINNKEIPNKSIIPVFVKYAAAAVILLGLAYNVYDTGQEKKQLDFYSNQEKVLEKKIQTATFVISNPLPTIELNVTKRSSKAFHVVAGAFQFPENAKRKVSQLKKKGFNAKILGVNKWGLTQVSFDSFYSRKKAYSILATIKKDVSKDAWILIKRF